MKTRRGYVSNSSSSSFVVEVKKDLLLGNEMVISEEKIKVLEGLGFRYVVGYPKELLKSNDVKNFVSSGDINTYEPFCMYKFVVCNEEDIIKPCLENHIPFYALVNYDVWFYVYDGINDFYEIFPNYLELYPYSESQVIKDIFYKDELVYDGYKRVYFNKKEKELRYEGIEDLKYTIENMNNKVKETFTQAEIDKINNFLFETNKDRFFIRKGLEKL